jgi:hypothetical protein
MPDLILADDLLARTVRTYAALESYSDQGELTSRIESSDPTQPRRTHRTRFATRWKRPDSLRFEFREMTVGPEDEWTKYVIWSRADIARTWWTIQPTVQVAHDLNEALAGAAGISGRLSTFIPNLLRGRTSAAGMPIAPDGFVGEEVLLDGVRCLCIGMQYRDRDEQLWIEAESALVLRHDRQSSLTKELSVRMHQAALARLDSDEPMEERYAELRAQVREATLSALREPAKHDLKFWDSARYFPVINPVLDDSDFEFAPPSAYPAATPASAAIWLTRARIARWTSASVSTPSRSSACRWLRSPRVGAATGAPGLVRRAKGRRGVLGLCSSARPGRRMATAERPRTGIASRRELA